MQIKSYVSQLNSVCTSHRHGAVVVFTTQLKIMFTVVMVIPCKFITGPMLVEGLICCTFFFTSPVFPSPVLLEFGMLGLVIETKNDGQERWSLMAMQ